MGQFNSNLTFYRSALKMQDGKPKKKLPDWTKQKSGTVAKPNLFEYLESKTNKNSNTPTAISNRNKMIRSTPPSDRQSTIDYYKNKSDKMMMERTPKTKPNKTSVFDMLEKKTNLKITQNPADFMPDEKLKVRSPYQKRVNKILGK